MNTHNIYFDGEKRQISLLFSKSIVAHLHWSHQAIIGRFLQNMLGCIIGIVLGKKIIRRLDSTG